MTQIPNGALRRFSRSELLFVALVVLLYFLLIDHFRTFSVDDAWFASFTYDFWNDGILTDTLYQRRFPHGMGGLEAFGKLAAFVQAPLMNILGWSLRGLEVLSTCFVSASLLLLADLCRRMGKPAPFTLCVLAVAGLTEPFVVASQGTRFEFLTLFLLMLALWCAVRGWVFPAALIACVSVEIEPAAVVVALGVFIALLMMPPDRAERLRRLPWMAVAAACAVGVYFALHTHAVSTFRNADWSSVDASGGTHGFVFQYLFTYKRHFVELTALLAALFVAVRFRRDLLRDWPAVALAAIIVASVVLRWGNPRYFVLLMPFFALFVAEALFTERRWKVVVWAVLAIMLPQYAYRSYASMRHAPALTAADQQQIGTAIERVAASEGVRNADARVLGNSNAWFAHPEHFVALDRRVVQSEKAMSADVVVCFENKLDVVQGEWGSELKCSELRGLPQPAQSLTLHGHTLQVIAATGKPITAPLPDWLLQMLKARGVSRQQLDQLQ